MLRIYYFFSPLVLWSCNYGEKKELPLETSKIINVEDTIVLETIDSNDEFSDLIGEWEAIRRYLPGGDEDNENFQLNLELDFEQLKITATNLEFLYGKRNSRIYCFDSVVNATNSDKRFWLYSADSNLVIDIVSLDKIEIYRSFMNSPRTVLKAIKK